MGKGRTRPPPGKRGPGLGLPVARRPAGAQRRRRKGRRGAGRRVAVTQGGQFKQKEGKAAAPRERGVGVAIAGHPWGRGGGSCPALPAAAACLPSLLAPPPGRCGCVSVSRWAGVGGPSVCGLLGGPGSAPLCFPGAGAREVPGSRSLTGPLSSRGRPPTLRLSVAFWVLEKEPRRPPPSRLPTSWAFGKVQEGRTGPKDALVRPLTPHPLIAPWGSK